MKSKIKVLLIGALLFFSLAGGWMHSAEHPFAGTGFGWVPFSAGLLSLLVVAPMFAFRRTVRWAYLLNGFTVIAGTVTMAHYSLALEPLWADILVLWAKFAVGRALFLLEVFPMDAAPRVRGWGLIRFPNMGFWYVHLALWGLVYWLGHAFWR